LEDRGLGFFLTYSSQVEISQFLCIIKSIMNKGQNNFTQQTHFIGVLLPEDITLTLEDCRRYMNQAYGCKSGHKTPIHVTLIPPFHDIAVTGNALPDDSPYIVPPGVVMMSPSSILLSYSVEKLPLQKLPIFVTTAAYMFDVIAEAFASVTSEFPLTT
jgi:hypothetical protein